MVCAVPMYVFSVSHCVFFRLVRHYVLMAFLRRARTGLHGRAELDLVCAMPYVEGGGMMDRVEVRVGAPVMD